jgi:hypothetical protein
MKPLQKFTIIEKFDFEKFVTIFIENELNAINL